VADHQQDPPSIAAPVAKVPEVLAKLGVPEQIAAHLVEAMRCGATLVSVVADDAMGRHALASMERYRVKSVRAGEEHKQPPLRVCEIQCGSVVLYTELEGTLPAGDASPIEQPRGTTRQEGHEAEYRENFEASFAVRGYTYEQCAFAYRFGEGLGIDPRFPGKDWAAIENDVQKEWEDTYEEAWEEFRDAVRYAWSSVQGRTPRVQLTV
jgi:hypothetical protein